MQRTNMKFFSEPSSPKSNHFASPVGKSYTDYAIDEFEFEFETSRRFDFNDNLINRIEKQNNQQRQKVDAFSFSSPAMAFADELFSEGKVLPLLPRLKLPPRLERGNDNRDGKSSTASSPRSPGSALKIKFVHQNLWNDDFDPFMAALQSVKEDGVKRTHAKKTHRQQARTQSPCPRRPNDSSNQLTGPQLPLQQNEQKPNYENSPVESPKVWTEPKGLAFARAIVKMGHATMFRPNRTTVSGPILRSKENLEDGVRYYYTKKRSKLVKLSSLLGNFNLKSVRSASS